MWVETQKVLSYQRTTSDNFGYSVAIYGDYAVACAKNNSKDATDSPTFSRARSGSAYVYRRVLTGRWVFVQKLKGSNSGFLDEMGTSVAMYQKQIIAGAPLYDLNQNVSITTDEGTAYIFEPCDTAITLNIIACDSFVSPSGNYTWYSNGQYKDTVHSLNSTNCNALYTINLSFGLPQRDTITVSSCDAYTSPSGKYIYTTSATYLDTISTVANCDSIIVINFTLLNSSSAQLNASACSSYTSPSNRYTWQTNGTYNDTLYGANSLGCDSIMTINLSIDQSFSTLNITSCYAYTSPSGRFIWSSSGTYMDTIFGGNAKNCDSNITVNLNINNSAYRYNVVACQSYISPSGKYNWKTSGTYLDTLIGVNSLGCDSLITVDLTIKTVDTSLTVLSPSIISNAFGATYQWLDCNNNFAPLVGDSNQIFMPTTNGSYAVQVIENNCIDTSRCVQIIGLGLNNLSLDQSIIAMPNPTSGRFVIQLSNEFKANKVIVRNILGETIINKTLNATQKIELNINTDNGIYFVEVQATNGARTTIKVIKQ